jgi:hypothetical protein
MKILLIGEYSGLYKNLRDGLRELGHQATLAAGGDGWKKLESDIKFDVDFIAASKIHKIAKNIKPFFVLEKLSGFDVVQLINPLILFRKYGINKYFIEFIIKNNNKVFLSAAGDDSFYANAVTAGKFRYSPLPDYISLDLRGRSFPYAEKDVIEWNIEIANRVDGIIPIAYEYAESYRQHPKVRATIPMPINVNSISYSENILGEQVVFYHGLNRPGFKGTRYIKGAFDDLKDGCSNIADFIIADSLPFKEYLRVLKATNVVIDQTSSYSCGMNALISMAMGKVVMGGNEPESATELKQNGSPAINITPDIGSIKSQILFLLDNKSSIPQMGYDSRVFIEKNHNYISVAEKYLKVWGS